MKRNAIVRIILWSIVLLVLLALFFALLYVPGGNPFMREDTPAETWIPVPLTEPVETIPTHHNAVITETVNIRNDCHPDAAAIAVLHEGDTVKIQMQAVRDNQQWVCITSPIEGWLPMEYTRGLPSEVDEIIPPAIEKAQEQSNAIIVDASQIREMAVEWAAGSIRILPKDITEIRITEEGTNQSQKPMVWKVRDRKLAIQYAENKKISLGIGIQWDDIVKDLIIEVPKDWQCDSLEVTAAAASLEVKDLTIREMEFDGASGSCVFDSCTVETLDLDTASGNVRFTGSLQQLECDAASADIVLELTNVPRSLDMDTASGDLDVTLPADAGFTVTLDTLSGDFESDFETTMHGERYVAGNGRCRIDVDAMSGDVTIRKIAN